MKGFRDFLLRGNVIELAVAVVIGIAFGVVINSFVKNLLTPLIAIPGTRNFGDLTYTVSGSTFRYGAFLNDLIAFVLIALAVYFVVVLPMNKLAERRARQTGPTTRTCPECLTEIPIEARKCAACGSVLPAPVTIPRP